MRCLIDEVLGQEYMNTGVRVSEGFQVNAQKR